MKKTIKVKASKRNGKIVKAHTRTVDSSSQTLTKPKQQISSIEDDTMIIPETVADTSIQDFKERFGVKMSPSKERVMASYLVSRTHKHYLNNPQFKKTMNGHGNKGRDALYAFHEHWLAGSFKIPPTDYHRKRKH
jgi:hypothetical protein